VPKHAELQSAGANSVASELLIPGGGGVRVTERK
jgi:hypothetical protein